MLEVINGVLLVYFLVMCTLSALVPYLVKPIAACFSKPSHEHRKARAELGALKEEQKNLSIKEDFAAFSKMQRRINKLEYDLKDDSQERIGKTLAVKASIHVVLQVVVAATILISVIWFRREPIVALKGNLFPLTSTLQYPSGMPNGVSTHVFSPLLDFEGNRLGNNLIPPISCVEDDTKGFPCNNNVTDVLVSSVRHCMKRRE